MNTLEYFNKVIVKYINQNIEYIVYVDSQTNILNVSSNILQVDLFLEYIIKEYCFINKKQLFKFIQKEKNLYKIYEEFLNENVR